MKSYKIQNMTRGWFIGNFEPSLMKTDLFEVGFKEYKAGDIEGDHYAKIISETILVTNGQIEINNEKFIKGDIITIEPKEITNFKAITDCNIVVIKTPFISNDKYFV